MSHSGRKDMRYPCAVPIVLTMGHTRLEATTEDVSYSGLFVVTDAALPIRQLVVLRALLPGGDEFTAHAMVVFTRAPRGSERAGVGLKLFGLARAALERWAAFVRGVAAVPVVPDPAARYSTHAAVVLRVRPPGLDALFEVYTRDLCAGGMFFETEQPLRIGSRLMAEIVHPDTGEIFEIECTVRRAATGPTPGVGVEFTGLDDERRQQLHEFVISVAPPIVIVDFEERSEPC